jgi:hypothetical protein
VGEQKLQRDFESYIMSLKTASDWVKEGIDQYAKGDAAKAGQSFAKSIELDPGSIGPAPRIGMRWRTDFIQGMGKRGDDFIIILDVNAVFSSEELALVRDSAPEAEEPVPAH